MENINDTKLATLLSTKSYSNLSREEKQFVLKIISSDLYDELFELQQNVIQAFQTEKMHISPDPDIRHRLVQAMNEKHKKEPSIWFLWLNYRLPLYQTVAASTIIGLLIYLGIFFKFYQADTTTSLGYQNINDTLNPDKYISPRLIAYNDSGLVSYEIYSGGVPYENVLKAQVMLMDRVIPEVAEIQMMDLAYKSLSAN